MIFERPVVKIKIGGDWVDFSDHVKSVTVRWTEEEEMKLRELNEQMRLAREVADDLDRAADELERVGFVEDFQRRRAIQRGVGVLRNEAVKIRPTAEEVRHAEE